MRAVIISVIILVLTVSFVTVNSVCTQSKLNNILTLIDKADTPEDIMLLIKKWDETERYLSLTIHRRELDDITRSLNDISIAYNNNDGFAFDDAKSSAKEYISEILSSQRLDLRSVI